MWRWHYCYVYCHYYKHTSSHPFTFSTQSKARLTIFDFQDYQVTLPESLITHGSNRRLVGCATWWMLSISAGINTTASRYLRISIGRSDKSANYQVVSSVPAEHIGTHFAALFCSPFSVSHCIYFPLIESTEYNNGLRFRRKSYTFRAPLWGVQRHLSRHPEQIGGKQFSLTDRILDSQSL